MLILVIPYEDDFGFGGPGCAPSMKIAILALSISVPEPNSKLADSLLQIVVFHCALLIFQAPVASCADL